MTIEIKISEKNDEEFNSEYLEILAKTSHPQKQIMFFVDGHHLATTMTDDKGCISAGTSFKADTEYFFEVECEGEHEGKKYHTSK